MNAPAFQLSQADHASEPPEARGLARDEVPGVQEIGQLARPRVREAAVAARDEHAHVVARQTARLGRRVGLEALGEFEGGLRAQARTLMSASP